MNQKEWFDYCIKNGTSGDQIFDILEDWEVDRLVLLDQIKSAEHKIDCLRDELNNRSGDIL